MLAWYEENGVRHLCDVEACDKAANAFALLEFDNDQVVWHFCQEHLRVDMLAIDAHMKVSHPIHYHVDLGAASEKVRYAAVAPAGSDKVVHGAAAAVTSSTRLIMTPPASV